MRISGTVLNSKSRAPVKGAHVKLVINDTEIASVNSDEQGRFEYTTEAEYIEKILDFVTEKEGFGRKKISYEIDKSEIQQDILLDEHEIEIKGSVYDETDNPLDNATLNFTLDKDNTIQVISDKNGSFSFDISEQHLNKSIDYEVNKAGFQTKTEKIQLKEDVQLDIKLVGEKKPIESKIIIKDNKKKPLEGAKVSLEVGGEQVGVGISDKNGIVKITLNPELKEKTIQYKAELGGFETAKGEVQLAKEPSFDITLKAPPVPGILEKLAKIVTSKWSIVATLIVIAILVISLPGKPVINSFEADEYTISPGGSSTLSWDVSNAASVTIEPELGRVESTGTYVVKPATTTTYTLTAKRMMIFKSVDTVTITVTTNVTVPPQLSVSEDSFDFGTMNAGESEDRTFSISNEGGGTLEWNVSADQRWMTVEPERGTNSSTVTLTINTAGLTPGDHTGRITIESNDGTKTGRVDLTIEQIEQPPQLSVSEDSFDFGTMNAGESEHRTFSISNKGGGTLNWHVSTDQTWMTVEPERGTNSSTVTLTINTAGLTPGDHTGRITIESNDGTKTGRVDLTIEQIEQPPQLSVSPNSINFTISAGELNTREFQISNAGGGTLEWSIRYNQDWIKVRPISGTNSSNVTVELINTGSLDPGNYEGTIFIESNGKTESIDVFLKILVFDFFANAPEARWSNNDDTVLPWEGERGTESGYVMDMSNQRLENNLRYEKVLLMHPKFVKDGFIKGKFELPEEIQKGDRFKAQVGFLKDAGSGKVTFEVYCEEYWTGIDVAWERVVNFVRLDDNGRDGELKTIDVDMTDAEGCKTIVLEVDAGTVSTQDWAVWVYPRIERS